MVLYQNISGVFESSSFFCFLMQLSSFIYCGSDLDLDLCVSLKLWVLRFYEFVIFYSFEALRTALRDGRGAGMGRVELYPHTYPFSKIIPIPIPIPIGFAKPISIPIPIGYFGYFGYLYTIKNNTHRVQN